HELEHEAADGDLLALDPPDAGDERVALRRALAGGAQPVPVLLGVGEAQRVLRLQLLVHLLEGAGVEDGGEAGARRPRHVVAARGADVEVLLDLLPVDDLVALLALGPQALHAGRLVPVHLRVLRRDAGLLREPGHRAPLRVMRRFRQVNLGLPSAPGEVRVTPAHAVPDAPVARAALRRRVPRLPASRAGADRPPP